MTLAEAIATWRALPAEDRAVGTRALSWEVARVSRVVGGDRTVPALEAAIALLRAAAEPEAKACSHLMRHVEESPNKRLAYCLDCGAEVER